MSGEDLEKIISNMWEEFNRTDEILNETNNVEVTVRGDKLRVSITEGKQDRWFDISEDTAWSLVDGLHRKLIQIEESRRGTK